jgi:hypothetical protein
MSLQNYHPSVEILGFFVEKHAIHL